MELKDGLSEKMKLSTGTSMMWGTVILFPPLLPVHVPQKDIYICPASDVDETEYLFKLSVPFWDICGHRWGLSWHEFKA